MPVWSVIRSPEKEWGTAWGATRTQLLFKRWFRFLEFEIVAQVGQACQLCTSGLVGDWGKGTGGPGVAGEPSGPRVAGGPGVPGGPGGAGGPGVPGMPGGPCGQVGPPVPRFLPVGAVVQVGAVVGQLRRVCQVGQVGLVGR